MTNDAPPLGRKRPDVRSNPLTSTRAIIFSIRLQLKLLNKAGASAPAPGA
jgi:hypothetical protein